MIETAILEHIGEAIYGLDADWRFIFFNPEAERFFGRARGEVMGRTVWEMFPAARGTDVEASLRRAMLSREPSSELLFSPTAGRWTDVRIFPLPQGALGVSWRDVTEFKKQELELRETLENQDLLFRELTHRVTNNFQEVASRLTLQGREFDDPGAREMCDNMAVSIRCMALVHRRLYRNPARIDEQDLGDYLRALCEDIASSLPDHLTLTSAVEYGTVVSTDVATTVGMMMAELIMNSRKYAWRPGDPGRMAMTMRREDGAVAVELRDDGRGVPEGMDLTQAAGLGLKLLQLQIKRLRGTFAQQNVPGGATFTLRFPAPRSPRADHSPEADESTRPPGTDRQASAP